MNTTTKRILKGAAVTTLIVIAFLLGLNLSNKNQQSQYNEGYSKGFKNGQIDVINNQIITDEEHREGVYFSEYKGEANKYWYENDNVQSIANQNKDKELFIKDQENTIILSCDFSNIPEDLQKAKVTSYMDACDTKNGLIIFIKE